MSHESPVTGYKTERGDELDDDSKLLNDAHEDGLHDKPRGSKINAHNYDEPK